MFQLYVYMHDILLMLCLVLCRLLEMLLAVYHVPSPFSFRDISSPHHTTLLNPMHSIVEDIVTAQSDAWHRMGIFSPPKTDAWHLSGELREIVEVFFTALNRCSTSFGQILHVPFPNWCLTLTGTHTNFFYRPQGSPSLYIVIGSIWCLTSLRKHFPAPRMFDIIGHTLLDAV